MSRQVKNAGPAFRLRGFEPSEIIERYNQGYYQQLGQAKTNIGLESVNQIFEEKISEDVNCPIFLIPGKFASDKLQGAFSNYQEVQNFRAGRPVEFRGPCQHCGCDSNMGLPIEHKEYPMLIEGRIDIKHCFWCQGRFCSFPCAHAYLRDHIYNLPSKSLQLLYLLLRLTQPNETILKKSPDPLLHQKYGGPLPEDKWKQCQEFQATTRVILFPSAIEFRK